MKHFLILAIVASVTLAIVMAIYRPEDLENIWLWIIGLIGPIIATVKQFIQQVKKLISNTENR